MMRSIAMPIPWFHRWRRAIMTEPSITKGHHHVPFPALPDTPIDSSPVPLAPLDMILRFSEGRHFAVHLSKEPCPALARELLMALVGLCDFGGTVNSPGRAELYTISIRKFVRFLATRSSPQECTLTVSDLTPRDLETFEEHLRARATHEESVSPYNWIGSLVRLLRWWRETHPERIPVALGERLAYIANGPVG